MAHHKLDPQAAFQLLERKGEGTAELVTRGLLLERLSQRLEPLLPPTLQGHCRVANLRDETLVLAVDSPAWASRVRFLAPALVEELSRREGLRLSRCRILVMPPHVPRRTHPARPLSARSRQTLAATAETLPPGPLRQALQRLAGRRRN
ncbi:MAG TPA: DUF721 domain-containing protein [Thiotrichales bacterium]|nr:DUF721 domain-containing protein [Thiotrichales bacterium]